LVSNKKICERNKKNLPTAQETSSMSLGPYFCFPHLPHVPIPHSSLPLFRCPLLLAASTHDPPCEQWLAGLGAGAGLFLLLRLLAHSCGGGWGVPVVVAPSPHHYCSPFHPVSSCSRRQLLSHPRCLLSRYPPCKQWV
jgi:hypothetical protein